MTPARKLGLQLSPLRHSPYGLGLREDSRENAIQPGNRATSTTTDARWGHFKRSRPGQCKPSFYAWLAEAQAWGG